MTEILSTPRLMMRPPDARDWPAARDFFMSDRAKHAGGDFDLGRAWRQFAAEVGHWTIHGHGMWAVTKGKETIGLIGPWCPADWPENEVGWLIFDGFEGQGYALEATQAVLQHCFQVLNWDTAVSYIDAPNARSIALAERLGARLDPDAPQPKPDHPVLVYRHRRALYDVSA